MFSQTIKESSLNQHSRTVLSRVFWSRGSFSSAFLRCPFIHSSLPSLQALIKESSMNHVKESVNLSVSQEGLYLNRTQEKLKICHRLLKKTDCPRSPTRRKLLLASILSHTAALIHRFFPTSSCLVSTVSSKASVWMAVSGFLLWVLEFIFSFTNFTY